MLTVHKAKGLEFPVVFLVGCAEEKFPLQRRARGARPAGELSSRRSWRRRSRHLHEERRLFYVAMTRAKDELVLTSAADYGTARARKVSRFVVEALDLPSPRRVARDGRRSKRSRAISRAPEPRPAAAAAIPDDETAAARPTARSTTTRPARSSTATCTCCACRSSTHHARRLRQRHAQGGAAATSSAGSPASRSTPRTLIAAFRAAWVSEGFLSREHEERAPARGRGDAAALPRAGGERPLAPAAVEQEFAFTLERNGSRAATTS